MNSVLQDLRVKKLAVIPGRDLLKSVSLMGW